MTSRLAVTLNALGLHAVALILLAAFALQFVLNELPCPLCQLQRVAFTALAVGPVLNLRYGPRPSHYALTLLAAFVGMTASGRQILLHILPGDPGYGSAIFGAHYYSWAFMGFAAAATATAAMMLFDRQFEDRETPRLGIFETAAIGLMVAVTLANVLNGFAECGPRICPDNPTGYWLFGG